MIQSDPPHTSKYLHGNLFQGRQVVLSGDLLEKGELTPVTIVRNTQMTDRFLEEARK